MSVICPRFTQNAWKKELCSNCFKLKDEHKSIINSISTYKKPDILRHIDKTKGIIKDKNIKKTKNLNVNFHKDLENVIGYGGCDSSDNELSDNDENINKNNDKKDDLLSSDEEDDDLKLLTKRNTDFNTNNGNLLGNPEDNIKKSFAALRLGTPQIDSDGKKKTLKITVMPFGTTLNSLNRNNKYHESKNENLQKIKDNNNSPPPIERTMEKSLLEEISETLEKNKNVELQKVELNKKNDTNNMKIINLDTKKSIVRNPPITKDHAKPKINIVAKYSDSDSNGSDTENGISAYYDVVETTSNNYENVYNKNNDDINNSNKLDHTTINLNDKKYSNCDTQFITDIFLSAKTRAASYSLQEGSFMTSKITTDGLIVTKCNSDDALDSTGSSFDGSSDDEISYNMNRSESDSGIGISIGADYQRLLINKKTETKEQQKLINNNNQTNSNDNSSDDYEDIQIIDENINCVKAEKVFIVKKNRDDPDGSSDPDQLPELPKSPPPSITTALASAVATTTTTTTTARISFLNDLQKCITTTKPKVPAKPIVNITPMKTFAKRLPTEQKVITQLQQFINSPNKIQQQDNNLMINNNKKDQLRKGKAPSPPPINKNSNNCDNIITELNNSNNDNETNILPIKTNSTIIREKEKRERATINPKFRSLNTFSMKHKTLEFPTKPSTPEMRQRKSLSISEEYLNEDKKKRNKFSIKKFLRMGSSNNSSSSSSSKTGDILNKKDGIYTEIAFNDDYTASGKPKLVIIHPIDINPNSVEVVKEIKKADDIISGKPPAPPQRSGTFNVQFNKPSRPPPPKSAELRRKQKIGFAVNTTGSVKCKADNVYANLGEIRSAIAPRKPERTASMREREAQLELLHKRQGTDSLDTISLSSSNGISSVIDNHGFQLDRNQQLTSTPKPIITETISKDENYKLNEQRKKFEIEKKFNNKLEIFDKYPNIENSKSKYLTSNDGLKNSVLKINNTIDNYLKDKKDYETIYSQGRYICQNNENLSLRQKLNKVGQNEGALNFNGGSSKNEYARPNYNNNLVNIPRAGSISYCGSEMSESDVYSAYSFYGSEGGGDIGSDIHDNIWGPTQISKTRVKTTNRLRMRKGRSVVHKNIEDNYSAVVTANHEALAQVLEQMQHSPVIPNSLNALASSMNLRFEDFKILENIPPFVVGKRAFHAGLWSNNQITLALSADCTQISGVSGDLNQLSGSISGALNPITEFCDLVPNHHLPLLPSTETKFLQATISILPRIQLDTLQSLGEILKHKSQIFDRKSNSFRGSIPNLNGQREQNIALRNVNSVQNLSTLNEECIESNDETLTSVGTISFDDILCREVGFIMLQLINGLKNLQAKAIEEIPLSLSNVILSKEIENKDSQARLCVLHGIIDEEEPMGTLCKCAYTALNEMLPRTKLTQILSHILYQERSESLSKAKSVLEFVLWGPSDVVLNGSNKEREMALQRWLDLERATVLHGLVRTKVELTVYDECHLMFLVRSNAKMMNEAAKIISNFELSNDKISFQI